MEEDGGDPGGIQQHKQETYGWVALPAAAGVFGTSLHYQALNTPSAVTHVPYVDVAFDCLYTCRRLIDLSRCAVCCVYTCRRLIDLSL